MAAKAKKPPKKKRPKQGYLDPEMDSSIPELDEAAEEFHGAKSQIKKLKETQDASADKLVSLLKEHKFATYKTPDGIMVSLKSGADKITVKKQTQGGVEHEFLDE